MTTEIDLRLAYRELVRQALSRDELLLTMRPDVRQSWRGRMFLPIVGAALATIAAVLAVLVVVRARANRHSGPAGPGARPTFPTEYWFGPASMPGYTLTSLGLSAADQYATYQRTGARGTATSVTLIGIQPTQQQLAAITGLTPVQVGAANGHSGALSKAGLAPTGQAVFWPLDANRWIAITTNSDDANGLAALAQSVRPTTDDHVALVKIGYLPANLRFAYTAQYLHQQQMLAPDGTVGTGYRTLSFIARGFSIRAHSTLDIVSVIDPFVNLASATIDDLPTFNKGPWQKTTVAGHLAWVAPHDVLIQWGSVQIGVSSSRVTGDNSTPVLSKTELLKIAAGLTVADSNAVGHGYPLATAVPDSAFD